MTRDELIQEAVKERIENQSKLDKIEQLERNIEAQAQEIKKFNKGFFIHFKFEGNKTTLNEIEKKIKLDNSIIRHLTVKYKSLDTEREFFNSKK